MHIYLHSNIFDLVDTVETADKLSEATGMRVVFPDFFDGKPFPLEKFDHTNPNMYVYLLKWYVELIGYL